MPKNKNRRAPAYFVALVIGGKSSFHSLSAQLFNQYAEEGLICRSVHDRHYAHVAPGYEAVIKNKMGELSFFPIPIPIYQAPKHAYNPGHKIINIAILHEPANEWLVPVVGIEDATFEVTHPAVFCSLNYLKECNRLVEASREAA